MACALWLKEALNLALEEAREERVEQEWLEKCRQEQELDEEHERQLLGFQLPLCWKKICTILEKLYMELYMMNRQHGRDVSLKSLENGSTHLGQYIEENRVTNQRKYSELLLWKQLSDCDNSGNKYHYLRFTTRYIALVSDHYSRQGTLRIRILNSHARIIDENGKERTISSETKFLNTLLLSGANFVTDVKPGLIVPVFQKGDDPIDAINHMMSFLTAVVTSRYLTTNNQLRNSSANPRQQATINDGRVTLQPVQGRQTSFAVGTTRTYTPGASGIVQTMSSSKKSNVVNHSETEITSDSNIIPYSQYMIESQKQINMDNKSVNDTLTAELERYKEQVKVLKEGQNFDLKRIDIVSDSSTQSIKIDRLKQTLSEHLKEKESLMQIVTLLKNDFKKEESININREIALEREQQAR
ncbi:hypothetical protein Tco_1576970 [Tanacetum coccineum]